MSAPREVTDPRPAVRCGAFDVATGVTCTLPTDHDGAHVMPDEVGTPGDGTCREYCAAGRCIHDAGHSGPHLHVTPFAREHSWPNDTAAPLSAAPAGTEGVPPEVERAICALLAAVLNNTDHATACRAVGAFVDPLRSAITRALTARAEAAEREVREHEEAEAACCPEDVGFREYIGVLESRITRLRLDVTRAEEGAARARTECAALAAEVAAATSAQRFAGWVLDQWQDEAGDLDAGDVEAQLIASGLLAVERRVVPCGDDCSCRDAADEGEATDCNRTTVASRAALRAYGRVPALPAPAPTMAGEP